MIGTWRTRLTWLLVLALDCLVVGAVGELWTRAFIPVKNVCWDFDRDLGPTFCPDQRRTGYVQGDYVGYFSTNSLGFHDVERALDKPPGTYRIHVYGDSMIVGGNVAVDETIPSHTEAALEAMNLGFEVEVFNLGLLESNSSALMTYLKVGVPFRPDMVVVSFMDDYPDNLAEVHRRPHHPHHRFDAEGRLVLVPPLPMDLATPWKRFKRTSLLYRLLANKLLESKAYHRARRIGSELRFRLGAGPAHSGERPGSAEEARRQALIERGIPLTLAILEEFRDRVEENGSLFVLSDGRRSYERNVATVFDNRDLESFCRDRGIAYVPTYLAVDRLQGAPDRGRLIFEDNHPTAVGNAILGEYLADHLVALISSSPPNSEEL